MFGSFGVSGEQASSTTTQDPWAQQIPYLTQGFAGAENLMNMGPYQGSYFAPMNEMQQAGMAGGYGAADPTQLMNRFYGFGDDAMGGYSSAMNYYRQAMEDPRAFSNPYESSQYGDIMEANRWTDADQAMADRMRESAQIGYDRSDFGDRSAAGGSGFAGGSKYEIARGLGAAETNRMLTDQLTGLEHGAEQRAYGMADQWANANMDQQYRQRNLQDQAASQSYGFGRQGIQDMQNAYNFGQTGYGNMAGWGDYGRDFAQGEIDAARQQHYDQWIPLQNYWNIVGGNSWGGTTQMDSSSMGFDASYGF